METDDFKDQMISMISNHNCPVEPTNFLDTGYEATTALPRFEELAQIYEEPTRVLRQCYQPEFNEDDENLPDDPDVDFPQTYDPAETRLEPDEPTY